MIPIVFRTRIFQDIPKRCVRTKLVHDLDIVFDSQILGTVDDLLRFEKRRIDPSRCLQFTAVEVNTDTAGFHEIFKVLDLAVDPFVSCSLLIVDVVQFAEDHVKRFFHTVKDDDLLPVLIAALDAEIRIDQQQ